MFCWQRRLDHGREKADEGASRLWIGRSSRDLLRLVGHGPGEQHEVFAQGYSSFQGMVRLVPQRDIPGDLVPRAPVPDPGDWETRFRSCKETHFLRE